MTTGERIKMRRKELSISAEALADMLSVSPATIYRYEKGDIEKLPSYVLQPIAEALNTTPAFLMGWEEEKNKPAPSNEDELIEALRNDPIKMELAQIIINLDHEGLEKLRAVVDLVKSGLQ